MREIRPTGRIGWAEHPNLDKRSQMEREMNQMRSVISSNIINHGQHIFMVYGTPHFMYSIGNAAHDLPELLLFTEDFIRGGKIMNLLGNVMRAFHRSFDHGEFFYFGGTYPVKIVHADDRVKQECTIQVGQFYGRENYSVQQIIIPDYNGLYPDEPGCKPEWREKQPLYTAA